MRRLHCASEGIALRGRGSAWRPRALRRTFGKAKTVEGMRLGGHMVGKRWVEDAYVYRVS